ncbi:MAG: beta strand repeat-containing protein [Akkermansia muciniphila]
MYTSGGYLPPGGTINAALKIEQLILTNGTSDTTYTFNGAITGESGAVFRVNSRAQGSATGYVIPQTFTFVGDLSGYYGSIEQGASSTDASYNGLKLQFSGTQESNTVAAVIRNSSGTGTISSNTEFTGSSIAFGTLTIDANKSMTVNAATTLTVSSALVNNGELVLNGNGNYSGSTIVNNGTISGTMNITRLTGFDTATVLRQDVSGTETVSGNGFSKQTATIFSGTGSLAEGTVIKLNGTDITSSLENGSTYSYWDKSTYYITEADTTLSIQSLNNVEGVTAPVIINNGATTGTTLQSSADATIGNIVSTAGLTIDVTGGTLTVGANSSAITVTKTGSGTLKYTAENSLGSAQSVLQIDGGEVISTWGGSKSAIRGAVVVNAGGKLTLTKNDGLGYDGGHTQSITLNGSSEAGNIKYATLDLGTTEQTMQTALNLNGYTRITGSNNGAFNAWAGDGTSFLKITANGNDNEITCRVLVRRGLELSVSENSTLTISGNIEHKANGESDAGIKKTGAGLLTIIGNTTLAKQLQVQGGTMAVAGSANSLDVAVKVSDGATLTLAGTTSLNGTLSSVAAGDDASAASTALIAITGGKTTISGGGGGNGAFAGTIRVDQGAELSITSGHANVLTGTQGKLVVNGTLSIGNKEGVNTAETFYNVSGSGLITSAQTYTETTGDDGSTTSTGRPVTIDLSTTDAFSGSVTATAGQVKLSGGRTENTLNTITANGGNVVIDSSMSATTISTSGTSAVSVTADATLTHDLMTYSGSTISGSNGNFSMFSGGTVTGGTVTQIGQDGSGYKSLNSQLSGVHFVSKEGTESHLNNSANSLTDLTVNGTVRLTQKAAVTGSTNVGTNGKLYVESTDSNLGKVSGTGTIQTTVSQDMTLNTESGKEFSGTLEASGANGVLSVEGVKELAALKVDGGQVWANSADSATSVSISEVVLAGGMVGVYSAVSVEATVQTGSLTVSGNSTLLANLDLAQNGTLTLDSSLTMGSTLTLNSGITLSGSLLTGWTDRSQALTLFSGVDELVLNGATATADKTYDASSVFSGMSGYNLVMTGGTGGQDYIVQLVQSTPSPEPTTATLSLLALMGLAARRRRRKA